MPRKSKLSYEEKLAAVTEYKTGQGSYRKISRKYGIGETTLKDAVAIYESQGVAGISPKKSNRRYSKELKLQAVTGYLSGKGSQSEICKKYKIFSRSQLREWIKEYNGHKDFREPSGFGKDIYMTKGRKTNQQERAEIVAFCIAHGKDYALTTKKYCVSYQQIYSWVMKYEAIGIDGLYDRRGKAKPESKMTEVDKLRAENKILEARIKDLEMENAFIKKLKELERGGH